MRKPDRDLYVQQLAERDEDWKAVTKIRHLQGGDFRWCVSLSVGKEGEDPLLYWMCGSCATKIGAADQIALWIGSVWSLLRGRYVRFNIAVAPAEAREFVAQQCYQRIRRAFAHDITDATIIPTGGRLNVKERRDAGCL